MDPEKIAYTENLGGGVSFISDSGLRQKEKPQEGSSEGPNHQNWHKAFKVPRKVARCSFHLGPGQPLLRTCEDQGANPRVIPWQPKKPKRLRALCHLGLVLN